MVQALRVMKVLHMGVGVIKTDFSEAVPEDAVYYDGRDGVEGHNRLTYLYAETIYRWMEEYKKETGELPMLWGRSGYARISSDSGCLGRRFLQCAEQSCGDCKGRPESCNVRCGILGL